MTTIVLTGGGTGGHLFPAIAVANALRALEPAPSLIFLGPENRGERTTIAAAQIPFEPIPAAPIRGRSPLGLLRSTTTLARGTLLALHRLHHHRPNAVFSTGGYGSFPVSLAAWLLRRPLVVFLPDVAPGLAVRVEKRLATQLATSTPAALAHLPPAKTTVTGYPVRPEFFTHDRATARKAIGLPPSSTLIVIAGASQGSRALNQAVLQALHPLLTRTSIIHITGPAGLQAAQQARATLPPTLAERYHPAPFRTDLPTIMLAADLGIFRAGASILGELPAAGLPAILVPGTFAGAHQRDNARWLADQNAAILLEETQLHTLPDIVAQLLDNPAKLQAMRTAAHTLARPTAAAEIARLIIEVAK
ncbi:UDP-N-acetylglucosamine--N-acetylmuramyl-(pentapeptide) pyrophosphoryl-undecaprenol N-acetylglucosamine transferase [Tepidiforma sp.]|uniref:UDP-N-acetylglucosamine--N-acetylmuramyl- (pentapeptide) pyrophosphoryl-undecaprenol N-acetylglucosamine transferase n=1 Tax=Tepidiforma sp. TaxID=2682230 RepID=UPI002ADDEBB4|nr:UDP-N-acetylglucosamine--N-acetylmuramyl-(pentapeptide) pyrophosphoryl-undecaprenol N-acetylglucosamine transferase [Tepidiforma sp.]